MRAMVRLSLLVIFSAILSFPALADKLEGKVIRVADGDTLTVLTAQKESVRVRVMGIDAPESGQPHSGEAKRRLVDSAMEKEVLVEYEKRDRYGRPVGKVMLDGTDLGLAQVAAGMAWHFKEYAGEQSEQDRLAYSAAEQRARSEKLGLWQDPAPVPPWEVRAAKRKK